MKNRIKDIITFSIPIVVFMVVWEIWAYAQTDFSVLFSSPLKIISLFFRELFDGDLIFHTLITGYEAFVGLILGLLLGCIVGFSLAYFQKSRYSMVAYYYLAALSAIPVFALAPLMIIWFGTGLKMKIVLAFLATVFTTAFQAYSGAQNVSDSDETFFTFNDATAKQRFWLLAFPASLDWVIQSLRLNAGFCLLGAFIGEFIASEKGLGYIILKASGLYDTTCVFVAIICIILLSWFFGATASIMKKHKWGIIRFFVDIANMTSKRTIKL